MNETLILQLLAVILVNALGNTTGTLRTIFSTKMFLKPLYIVTFLDAIIFATAMKQISNGNGIYFIIAFAIGKVLGAFIANIIEQKMALGIIETDLYISNKDKMKDIADSLREKGYSVNTYVSYGIKGIKRYKIEVTLLRKELKILEQILEDHDYKNPTFKTKNINGINGKMTISSFSQEKKEL